ncbi:peptidase domain-containing ABC transporter [Chitinophaga tropicalis]|uniref:ATP-binding cassette domain-containing protein n=1 Tax=Chitinophaga tropicalis TaxID=2683588 RepID=A0A7K1UDE4_9BACT|nr:peptidase domain-containing ABC transporter [Chitinophaga tropicalis]MVT12298.1 ATP-binding cassette domain-containing protein [Chitinophaga tropicalis]
MTFSPQHDQMDCGPACLAMVASCHGKIYGLSYLREYSFISREGVSLLGISEAAQRIGMETLTGKLTPDMLAEKDTPLPAILHWNQNHFVVLCKVQKRLFTGKTYFKIADPAHGLITLSQERFEKNWISDDGEGVALFLQPTDNFYNQDPPKENNASLRYLFSYLIPYKRSLISMLLLLLLGSGISLIFPFLTQNLIDKGVNGKDLNFITLILLAQLGLYFGSLMMELLRNWIMMIVGTKINIQIISDFLKKLLKLPIKFFDTKLMGDFNQRISDHDRIESFLTSQSLLTFFSMITFMVFFGVLWYYNPQLLFVYLGLSVVAVLWSLFWLKKRKILDYFRFQMRSENQESIYEMMSGVTEMKLNQFEEYKRNEWEKIQHKIFKINIRILKLNQVQLSGFELLNQLKNILVTFLAASLVIKEQMTLGALLSVSYIIGQMNSPINQLMSFFRSLQDARLSLARLNEIQHHKEEEESSLKDKILMGSPSDNLDFQLSGVDFQYEGPSSPFVLKNIYLHIPQGKVTAIVGASGSGKTTLMKLLLKFYEPVNGHIFLGDAPLNEVSHLWLRRNSGVVLQDGFIFGDTIERNIVCGDEHIDEEKLQQALHIANIQSFIASLPLGLNTKIGSSGNGLSGGQRQRILIARAVYKNPQFLFLDEATSALDAENEKVIHNNLQSFFTGKTVVIIAHRLSTVKNADQIIVLRDGQIVESGTHNELVATKMNYYNLVKNQLELGT